MKTPTYLFLSTVSLSFSCSVFISEFHYDNTGSDVGEFVEIYANATETGLATVTFYNGNGGAQYGTATFDLDNDTPSGMATFGSEVYNIYSVLHAGLQNGTSDGFALSVDGVLCEFISYEGELTGNGGVADGVTSLDVGVFQSGVTGVGASLALVDSGWSVMTNGTPGAENVGLTISPIAIPEPSTLTLLAAGCTLLATRRRCKE